MTVTEEIIASVLPRCYYLINELLKAKGEIPKHLMIEAKRMLPKQYSESFEK
jgi:hypothetical protein